MNEAKLCGEQEAWRREMEMQAAYHGRAGNALGGSSACVDRDRLSELDKRLAQHIEHLAGLVGMVEGFNNRVLGPQPERDVKTGPSPCPNGKLDELAETIARLGRQIDQLGVQLQNLERIG